MSDASKNLLRDSIYPQEAGRWVPGGFAATHPHAALRGARFLAYPFGMSRSLCSVRLALKPLATVFQGVRRLGIGLCFLLFCQSVAQAAQELKPFERGSHQQIVSARAGKPFIVAFWSVNCTYCGGELAMFGKLLRKHPGLDLVLVSTDAPTDGKEIAAVLDKHALARAEAWVFADGHADRLRFEVDPEWYGELPRTYLHGAHEGVQAVSGKIEQADVERWLKRQQR